MASIHLLPPLVQNQIAAGEVVERPVSVVKELVENSLDAGATAIKVSLEEGGIARISVEDNGNGMDKEDLLLSCVRHATSKISQLEDLQHIASMGFRGEALASISSVAKVTVTSRTSLSPFANQLSIEGDHTSTLKEVAAPVGTRIDVEALFFNVPARKKYLRSSKTEYGLIMRYMTEVALLYPHIRFELLHEGRSTALFAPGSEEERLKSALGSLFLQEHLAVTTEHPDIMLHGYISKPHVQRSTRVKQYLFVNNRPVKSDILTKAIAQAYHRIVDEGRYPSVVLFLTVHPTLVDVNVHPRKLEVRFHDPQFLFSLVSTALRKELMQEGGHRSLREEAMETKNLIEGTPTPLPSYNPFSRASSPYAAPSATRGFNSQQVQMDVVLQHQPLHFHEPKRFEETNSARASGEAPYRILGQLLRCYIVLETAEGLLLVDQHAAHERILFDRLTLLREQNKDHVQALLTPHLLHLSPEERIRLEQYQGILQESGFHLDQLDESSWSLTSLPADLPVGSIDIESTFHTILGECEDMETGCSSKHLGDYREKLHAYTACRSAVKFGDALTMPEMEAIMQDLWQTPRRYTCPHGRTSIVALEKSHLMHLFNR